MFVLRSFVNVLSMMFCVLSFRCVVQGLLDAVDRMLLRFRMGIDGPLLNLSGCRGRIRSEV